MDAVTFSTTTFSMTVKRVAESCNIAIMMRGVTTISKMTFSKMAKLQLSVKHFCISNATSFIVLLSVVLLSVV
jgi:hypothetical protein